MSMNRREFLSLAGCTAAGVTAGHLLSKAAWAREGKMPVVELSGSPLERGRMHGEALRPKIGSFLQAWKGFIHASVGVPADDYVAGFLGHTQFPKAMMKWTPDLVDELKGISEGAAVDHDTLMAFNFTDEYTWYGRYTGAGMKVPGLRGCSTIGFAGYDGRPAIIGQNMDIASGSKGYEVLLHIRYPESDLESFVFSVAGMVGIIGLNNGPLGVINNSLRQLNVRADGLPVNCVVRGLLDQPHYDAAVRFLHEVKHASGQNYILGGSEWVTCWECSADSVVEFVPKDAPPGIVYHTNDPFVNGDMSMYTSYEAKTNDKPEGLTSSQARCAVLEKHLRDPDAPRTVETIQTILRSQENKDLPVSRPWVAGDPGATYTAASVVYELSKPPVLHIAPGPPHETPYEIHRLSGRP